MRKSVQTFLFIFILSLLYSCQNNTIDTEPPKIELPPEIANMETPYFITKDSLLNTFKLNVVRAYLANRPVYPESNPLNEAWQFALENPAQGVEAGIEVQPQQGANVDLPHLKILPKSAMWYSKTIDLDFPTFIAVDADDDAQVFQDGQRLTPEVMNIYALAAKKESKIAIRVLNNQHLGGLKSVGTYSAEQFSQIRTNELNDIFIKKLTRQAIESNRLSESMSNEIVTAIKSGNLSTIKNAERYFPPLLVKPYLQKPDLNTYTILYERSTMTSTQLDWRNLQSQTPNRFLCGGRNTLMCETNSDLFEPGVPYKVDISDNRSVLSREMLAPENKLNYTFTAWGDSKGNWETFSQLVKLMSGAQDAFTIGLGNLVKESSQKQDWVNFFNCLEPINARTPIYVAPGESDYKGYYNDLYSPPIVRYFRNSNNYLPFHSWRSTYAAFIVLDLNRNFPAGIDLEQGRWLEQQLASRDWQSAQWRFLIVHEPPYSQGRESYSGDKTLKDLIDNMAGPTKIDFVLSGYTNNFERLTKTYGDQETTFLVLGGAGAELEEEASSSSPVMDKVIKEHHYSRFFMQNEKVRVITYNLQGQVIDDFERVK